MSNFQIVLIIAGSISVSLFIDQESPIRFRETFWLFYDNQVVNQ